MSHSPLRFPRSMAEVWPWHGVIEHHRAPLAERICGALLAVMIGVVGALALLQWMGWL